MKQTKITVLSALLLLTYCLRVDAERSDGLNNRDILKKVNLTQEQKEKLKSLKEVDDGKIVLLRSKKLDHKLKLEQALGGTASKDDLRKLHRQLKEIDAEYDRARFEQILNIRELLTVEQRAKFKELKDSQRTHPERLDADEGE